MTFTFKYLSTTTRQTEMLKWVSWVHFSINDIINSLYVQIIKLHILEVI